MATEVRDVQIGHSGRANAPARYRRCVNEQAPRPQLFGNRFADAVGSGDIRTGYDLCTCFDYLHVQVSAREVRFHREVQDTWRIFGNFKYRPPFPALRQGPVPLGGPDPGLWGADSITSCSVCGGPVTDRGVRQAWLPDRAVTASP